MGKQKMLKITSYVCAESRGTNTNDLMTEPSSKEEEELHEALVSTFARGGTNGGERWSRICGVTSGYTPRGVHFNAQWAEPD